MRSKIRFALFGLLVAVGLALAPSAFARGHLNVGIGLSLPGINIGLSDCRHCGGGWGGNYYGGYSTYYAPAYYAPAYYSSAYYAPSYYGSAYYPSYGSVYYSSGPGYRSYYRGRNGYYDHRGRGGDYGHRAQYYDRSGGYRH